MTALAWDQEGKKFFETGTDRGVLYVSDGEGGYKEGVAWNGLTNVNENPEGAEATTEYADNAPYMVLRSAERFRGTIQAYTYPDEFMACDGRAEIAKGITVGQQTRVPFCVAWRSKVGNDTQGEDAGEKLHIWYNCTASPSAREFATTNADPSAVNFSWDVDSTPVSVSTEDGKDYKATSIVEIDSMKVGAENYKKICDKLWGDVEGQPTLLMPKDIAELVSEAV